MLTLLGQFTYIYCVQMWCKSQDTGITERQLFVPGRGGFNTLGHCWAGNIAFISSLLEGLFLNNDDVPGFENTSMGEEVLARKSEEWVWNTEVEKMFLHQISRVTDVFLLCLLTPHDSSPQSGINTASSRRDWVLDSEIPVTVCA